MEGEIYFESRKGDTYKNDGLSNTYLHHGNFQNPKSLMWHNKLHFGQILVGLDKGWEENTLDQLEEVVQSKRKRWDGLQGHWSLQPSFVG